MSCMIVAGESPSGLSPPAGPPKIRSLQFSHLHSNNPSIFWNLKTVQSSREKFSGSSRFQNLKLHTLNSNLTAFHQNRSTGSRDICIFVEFFFGKSASHSRHDLPCACAIKYSLYVCTSHVYCPRCGRKPVRAWAPGRAAESTIPVIFAIALQKITHFPNLGLV